MRKKLSWCRLPGPLTKFLSGGKLLRTKSWPLDEYLGSLHFCGGHLFWFDFIICPEHNALFYSEESERVSELKNVSGSAKLPYGALALGAEGIKDAITNFDDAYVPLCMILSFLGLM
jgi:hypothetical protein